MVGKKFCPNCGSEEIVMIAGGTTGSWMCKNCGFSGSIFPEREIVGREQKTIAPKKIRRKGQ